jgi:predicted dehydrogenase
MTIHLALVGGAHIHTPGFIDRLNKRKSSGDGGIVVKYVWDHDTARAQRRAEALHSQVASDVNQIWDDQAVSAVIICSETDRHLPLVLAAAQAGKHLFVEKPLGLGAQDATGMADAIEKAGVIFQTGYFMRGNPIFRFLKENIQAGNFGMVTRYRQTNCHAGSLKGWFDTEWLWMTDLQQAGCGAFGDLGTHALDIMLWLLGSPTQVTADLHSATKRYGVCDEYGEGLLQFPGGTIGSLAAGWVDIAHPISLVISGTAGYAHILNNQLFFQSELVSGADGKNPWTDLSPAWPHAFDLFLDAIGGQANIPLVTAREAALRSIVMEAFYTADRTKTWVKF